MLNSIISAALEKDVKTLLAQVNKVAVDQAIAGYFQLLTRGEVWKGVSGDGLEAIVKKCIPYAWNDAILNAAGKTLGISDYTAEIAVASQYLTERVTALLKDATVDSKAKFDAWHAHTCRTLTDSAQYFTKYAAYRRSFKGEKDQKIGFTYGNAQKFVNMTLKDVFACLRALSKLNLVANPAVFSYCHMPLDSIILRNFLWADRKMSEKDKWSWSRLNDEQLYLATQREIADDYVSLCRDNPSVLEAEFVAWLIGGRKKFPDDLRAALNEKWDAGFAVRQSGSRITLCDKRWKNTKIYLEAHGFDLDSFNLTLNCADAGLAQKLLGAASQYNGEVKALLLSVNGANAGVNFKTDKKQHFRDAIRAVQNVINGELGLAPGKPKN